MRCEVASNRDKDMPPRFRVPPFAELTYPGVEHLKGMEACVLARQSMRQGRNDQIRRMAQREMADHTALKRGRTESAGQEERCLAGASTSQSIATRRIP